MTPRHRKSNLSNLEKKNQRMEATGFDFALEVASGLEKKSREEK